ncbi:MAG TPA: hypothetical protein VFJ98_02955 [Mycobacteriales bacterium]|nr:hypothetical protein [Mycobacteriales bacterium]
MRMSRAVRMPATATATALALVVVAGCGSGGSAAQQGSGPSTTPTSTTYTSPPASLPAEQVELSTANPPWLPPAVIDQGKNSAAYVAAAGLPYSEEMLEVHYHAHLDITADGKKVTVPPYIGFVVKGDKAVGLAPLHTHQDDGIIHIENSVPATFTLGQFFIEWGVRLTSDCVGGLCAGNGKELAVYVDGQRITGDPGSIVLKKHEEIAIEYGDTGKLPTPPSSYDFPSGL